MAVSEVVCVEYGVTAAVTAASAFLGVVFSLGAVRREQGPARSNALYMLARSLGLFLLAAVPCLFHSSMLLTAVTGAMLLVKAVDGLVGLGRKSLLRTMGPFLMALLHGVCLVLLWASSIE